MKISGNILPVRGIPDLLETGWTNPITQLTISSTSADQALDDLRFVVYDVPSVTPTSTNTPPPTATNISVTPSINYVLLPVMHDSLHDVASYHPIPISDLVFLSCFFFTPISITVNSGNAQDTFADRTGMTNVALCQFHYSSGQYLA